MIKTFILARHFFFIGLLSLCLISSNLSGQVTVNTFSGSGTAGFQDGNATTARFYSPWGITIDSKGNFFVVEQDGHRIRKITPNGAVSNFAGNGNNAFANGVGVGASFQRPRGITIDANDNLYVIEETRVRKITPDGTVSTFSGNGTSASVDGTAIQASFTNNIGITIDKQGNLFVLDANNDIDLRKITPEGVVSTIVTLFDGGQSLAIDAANNLYTTNWNNQVVKITPQGVISTFLSSGTINSGMGLVMHPSGNLYVLSAGNNRIYKINPAGVASLVVGSGSLSYPSGLVFDSSGFMYVTDTFNHKIVRVGDPVLPVTFTSLNAQINGSNQLQVTWQTVSEANNKSFIVQTSINGNSWTDLGVVATKALNGNSSEIISYSVTYPWENLTLAGFSFLGLLLIPAMRNKALKIAIFIIAIAMLAACSKQNDGISELKISSNNKQSIYVRIAQVDYNGTTTYSEPTVVKTK